jgi:hypothetical protein
MAVVGKPRRHIMANNDEDRFGIEIVSVWIGGSQ